ncbi:Glutamyl-tRNA synthetase [invertebrate metagenome]|uniref:glutamate--tRNA ligase n=1 Tax=invertebrate metagenome TaxID=1711999 RepID=A0A484H7I0_9ZZZZ
MTTFHAVRPPYSTIHEQTTGSMTIVTRFAPSPTGFLHIGGARTALFNWLYAQHWGGRFHLRIEDTDRVRSTSSAVNAIINSMKWLEIPWDGDILFQSSRIARHISVANQLLKCGCAYFCYSTMKELAQMREAARRAGQPIGYDGRWRDRDSAEAPPGVLPTIRLRVPREGETVLDDLVQGRVIVMNKQIDDMVLLRADNTPTYMLSVVVDDHDMGVTHVIRGDDHLLNAFRQAQIYQAMGWDLPQFAHIPLIHGPDGTKLSKRHHALGVETYREMGFLPIAMRNYLIRLGWSYGDTEIFTKEQAVTWFDIRDVGRSAARFDIAKLTALNAYHLRRTDDSHLVSLVLPHLATLIGMPVSDVGRSRLGVAMPSLKIRARTISELARIALFYVQPRPLLLDDKACQQLNTAGLAVLAVIAEYLSASDRVWNAQSLEDDTRYFAISKGITLSKLTQPLRASLTGSTTSPPIFEVMKILGREETLARLEDVLARCD